MVCRNLLYASRAGELLKFQSNHLKSVPRVLSNIIKPFSSKALFLRPDSQRFEYRNAQKSNLELNFLSFGSLATEKPHKKTLKQNFHGGGSVMCSWSLTCSYRNHPWRSVLSQAAVAVPPPGDARPCGTHLRGVCREGEHQPFVLWCSEMSALMKMVHFRKAKRNLWKEENVFLQKWELVALNKGNCKDALTRSQGSGSVLKPGKKTQISDCMEPLFFILKSESKMGEEAGFKARTQKCPHIYRVPSLYRRAPFTLLDIFSLQRIVLHPNWQN